MYGRPFVFRPFAPHADLIDNEWWLASVREASRDLPKAIFGAKVRVGL
jgi:hypothetical protein